jgi:hypothetical protein
MPLQEFAEKLLRSKLTVQHFQRNDMVFAIQEQPDGLCLDMVQAIEVQKSKIRRVILIIEANVVIGRTISRQAKDICSYMKAYQASARHEHKQLQIELDQHLAELQMHRRKAMELLNSIQSLDSLVGFNPLRIIRPQHKWLSCGLRSRYVRFLTFETGTWSITLHCPRRTMPRPP